MKRTLVLNGGGKNFFFSKKNQVKILLMTLCAVLFKVHERLAGVSHQEPPAVGCECRAP